MADHMEVDDDDLWTSPVKNAPPERPKTPKTPRTPTPRTPKTPVGNDHKSEPLDRDAMLRKELEGVRSINRVIEGVIGTLQRTGNNMDSVSQTVSNASTLLNTWTRILSQTEHNQRLILDPTWKGATNDLAEIEAEALRKQQAEARRAAEEEERREEVRRRREEEELRRSLKAPASASARGARGTRTTAGLRGARGRTRVASASSRIATRSTYSSSNTASTGSSSRGTSGIGRGIGTTRSRYGRAK